VYGCGAKTVVMGAKVEKEKRSRKVTRKKEVTGGLMGGRAVSDSQQRYVCDTRERCPFPTFTVGRGRGLNAVRECEQRESQKRNGKKK